MRQVFQSRKFRFAIPFLAFGFLALVSYVVMLLWNNLLPDILHVTTITFWQAMGIFILSKILFGFGGKGGRMGPPWMKGRMAERFKNMSPEERDKFKEEWAQRCGGWGGRGFGGSPVAEKTASAEENINPS